MTKRVGGYEYLGLRGIVFNVKGCAHLGEAQMGATAPLQNW